MEGHDYQQQKTVHLIDDGVNKCQSGEKLKTVCSKVHFLLVLGLR